MPTDNNDSSSFWNSILTGAMSAYASGKKKKEDNKQLDWMNSILEDKRRYEDEKISRYKSSPAAQMSPMIMEMLVNAYGPKFKKYGIDMPLDKMLAAINGGSQGAPGASGGVSGGNVQQRSLSQIANGEEPTSERTLSDMIAAQLGANNQYSKKNGVMALGTGKGVASEWESAADRFGGPQSWGASTGDIGSRENTRSMGNMNSKGGSLATGGTATYTPKPAKPGVTVTAKPDNRTIHASEMDYDNFGTQNPAPEDIMGGNGGVNIDKLIQDNPFWMTLLKRGVDMMVPGAGAAIGGVANYGSKRGWFGPGDAYMGDNPGNG